MAILDRAVITLTKKLTAKLTVMTNSMTEHSIGSKL